MSDTAIRVRKLSKRYYIARAKQRDDMLRDAIMSIFRCGRAQPKDEEVWALNDVSFDIKQGEVVGVIGRNGAGKSTLLKILSRITEPTEGKAEIYGRVGSLLEVGTGFHPELTGRDNIYLNGAILGMRRSEISRKFDEIVEFAEVSRFLDTPVKRYSSGMYVRLAFAVAAHLEPEILLVDEVLAVGDASFQDKCLGKMGDVAKSGRTVLFVSHALGSIQRLCQHCLWIDAGQIAGTGRSEKVIGAYLESASSQQGVWRAEDDGNGTRPQGVALCVRQVNLRTAAGHVRDHFQMDSPFAIEVAYDVPSPVENLRFGVTIISDDGTAVFESKDTDPVGYGVSRGKGSYIASCRIPGDLLNAGRYYASVKVDRPLQEIVYQRDLVLRFVIEPTDERGFRPGETRPGVVRPLLEWEHQVIES